MIPPDRAHDPRRQPSKPSQPLNVVRGGSVCDPNSKGAHILQGSMSPAICFNSPFSEDNRPRWRPPTAITHLHAHARHSLSWWEHRGIRRTKRGLEQL